MHVPRLLLTLALVGFATTISFAKGGSSGGHGGGHASSGQAGSHSGGAHPAGPSHARPAPTVATATSAKTGGVLVIGSAALPVVNSGPDLFLATPNTYAPQRPIYAAMGSSGLIMIAPDAPAIVDPSNDSASCVTCDLSANNEYAGAAPPYDAPASDTGETRLDVQPGFAQIFVDGYFVGTVDDFYHSLAGLGLHAGPHHVEFRAPGYEAIAVDMMITAGRTITYRAALKPLQP
jgi:hypothetical protein